MAPCRTRGSLAGASDDAIDVAVGLDDLLLLPHTSGTVGRPKGVMLTHGNVTWNVVNLLSVADFRHDDVTIAIAPFFRVGGTGVNVLPVLFMGGTVVVPEDSSPDGILLSIERHRVTVGFGNPDLLESLLRSARWSSIDLSSIRFVITGGAPGARATHPRVSRARDPTPAGIRTLRSEPGRAPPRPGEHAPEARVGGPTAAPGGYPHRRWRRTGRRLRRDGRAVGPRPQRHGRLLEATCRHAPGA